jgi:hypothetical protein
MFHRVNEILFTLWEKTLDLFQESEHRTYVSNSALSSDVLVHIWKNTQWFSIASTGSSSSTYSSSNISSLFSRHYLDYIAAKVNK